MGQSPLEWGDFPFVHLSVCPSVHSPLWVILLSLRPSQPGLKPEAWLSGWLGLRSGWLGLRHGRLSLRPGWLGLRPYWMVQRKDVRIYVHMYGQTENLPILQDFVLYLILKQFCLNKDASKGRDEYV